MYTHAKKVFHLQKDSVANEAADQKLLVRTKRSVLFAESCKGQFADFYQSEAGPGAKDCPRVHLCPVPSVGIVNSRKE